MADPGWKQGHYYGTSFPVMGMQHARELATISYRSGPEWEERFGNKRADESKTPDFCPDFLIETYLEKQVCTHVHIINVYVSNYPGRKILYQL